MALFYNSFQGTGHADDGNKWVWICLFFFLALMFADRLIYGCYKLGLFFRRKCSGSKQESTKKYWVRLARA